jgi:hypothetical protein
VRGGLNGLAISADGKGKGEAEAEGNTIDRASVPEGPDIELCYRWLAVLRMLGILYALFGLGAKLNASWHVLHERTREA